MKSLSIAGLLAGMTLAAPLAAHADPFQFHGSDTMAGAINEAITTGGFTTTLQYLGGGSGTGESGLINGTQGIAPMSRALTTAAINTLLNQGVTPTQTTVGLDGVSLFVQAQSSVTQVAISDLQNIFTCTWTDWSQVPGSGKTGPIAAYRRNDVSGTTDTFKTLVGITTFGACVTIVDTTEDIASHTANETGAIGYAGLSGHLVVADHPEQSNRELAVVSPDTGDAVLPSEDTIRDFSYPLSRRLFINSISGARSPNAAEQAFLKKVLDRSFFDQILVDNQFVTCPSDDDGGCP